MCLRPVEALPAAGSTSTTRAWPIWARQLTIGPVLHGHHNFCCASDEVRRITHVRNHPFRHLPVGQVSKFVDLQAAQQGHVQMTASDQPETHGTVDAC